ncbi:hypothetical protein J7E81_21955 [Bacillus sp. ISL-18]|uniref:hypothetical protein n=1 Tax=Bacillus sp. ISL-18 TaxID=2819118 RepID=UPI001BEA0AE6|nr:hypothetical protein [Bacillus sp. ISL-18]MBT2657870.1 hypothetical protein [Bacillus sp. ISL-18]
MKFSKQSLDTLLGVHRIVRHRGSKKRSLEDYFENPIIHKEIQGDRVFVPLSLDRVWNEI